MAQFYGFTRKNKLLLSFPCLYNMWLKKQTSRGVFLCAKSLWLIILGWEVRNVQHDGFASQKSNFKYGTILRCVLFLFCLAPPKFIQIIEIIIPCVPPINRITYQCSVPALEIGFRVCYDSYLWRLQPLRGSGSILALVYLILNWGSSYSSKEIVSSEQAAFYSTSTLNKFSSTHSLKRVHL